MLRFLIGIIDIGSTGTRFNIFGFNNKKDLKKYEHYEVKGGLHKMNDSDIKHNIEKLILQLPSYVFNIPLGIYCTAGFRHPLNIKKLRFIKTLFNKFKIKEYGILSGEYEGYLGYQSLKYFLKDPNFILIDMGGKSTQVATRNYYKSYKIGFTNISDVVNLKNIKQIDNNFPIYISSGLVKDKYIDIKNISNKYLRIFLNKLGIKKNLIKAKVNWTLGMALRYVDINR